MRTESEFASQIYTFALPEPPTMIYRKRNATYTCPFHVIRDSHRNKGLSLLWGPPDPPFQSFDLHFIRFGQVFTPSFTASFPFKRIWKPASDGKKKKKEQCIYVLETLYAAICQKRKEINSNGYPESLMLLNEDLKQIETVGTENEIMSGKYKEEIMILYGRNICNCNE